MKDDTYRELNRILQEFCEERNALQEQFDRNQLTIREADAIAQRIRNNAEDNFDIFSPRRNREMYRDELEQSGSRKAECEEQNKALTERLDRLNGIINVLQQLMDESEEESETENTDNTDRTSATIADSFISDLDHMIHKMELSYQFISQDPVRAKQELRSVIDRLKRMIDEMV